MYLLLIGIIALALKYLEIAPVVDWSWWVVLMPFGLAVAWWAWADSWGYSKRKEIEKMDKRKSDRIKKQRDAIKMPPRKKK